MRYLPLRSLCLCLASAFASGCGTGALHVPRATQVNALQIDNNRGVESETRRIDDPQTIAAFVARIDAWADRWYEPHGNLPNPSYRVFLDGNYVAGSRATVTSGQVIVFLGEKWVAAREVWEFSAPTRMLNLSSAEMADLHRLLGIPQ